MESGGGLGEAWAVEFPGGSRDLSGMLPHCRPWMRHERAGCRLEIGAKRRTEMDRLVQDSGPSANALLGSQSRGA